MPDGVAPGRRSPRRATTVLAVLIVWAVLVAPDRLDQLTPATFLRIPVEGLVLVGFVLVLPPLPGRILAAVAGLLLGLLEVVRLLDMGFYEELGRPFNPVIDGSSLGPAVGVLRNSVGGGWAKTAVVGAVLLAAAVVSVVTWSAARLCAVPAGRRTIVARAVGALAVVWLLCAALGLQLTGGAPVASWTAARLAGDQISAARSSVQDRNAFGKAISAADPYRQLPARDLLTGLRGKDVIFAFVESYGRIATEGSTFSPGVGAVLDAATTTLGAAGFSSRSAYLTSPTFGGISWLAHSTFQSGLWVDDQQRYDQLLASDRFTLSDAFGRAGWRTVGDVPSNTEAWPAGQSFYGYDELYDEHDVGYAGPRFSYASMPDQYTLSAFQRLELAPGHAPVMAEIDLVSSHTPWTPLPRMIDPAQVGDGSVFHGMPEQGLTPEVAWRDPGQVRSLYGQSIEYSLSALTTFVATSHDPDLVLVLLGDHQPATIVSGAHASHDVPITIVAADPTVLDRISAWDWQDGMRPGPRAPVWPMDSFRNRFLTAFGPLPPTGTGEARPTG